MKRHRIFSYILMFLIIGMCVRNLHYVYALDEEEISVSLENAEEAGDGSESVENPGRGGGGTAPGRTAPGGDAWYRGWGEYRSHRRFGAAGRTG